MCVMCVCLHPPPNNLISVCRERRKRSHAILQGFPLLMPGTACACPLFISSPPNPILKRGRGGGEWGEQQENSGWDSAARSVVARAERMACCVGQRRYCVSGLFSPSVFCPFFYEYDPSFQGSSSSGRKGAGKKKVSARSVVENLLEDRDLRRRL